MATLKKILLFILFTITLVSCRDIKKEEPKVEIDAEKVIPQDEKENTEEENTESVDLEEDYPEEESEIEKSEEETDTLSIEE